MRTVVCDWAGTATGFCAMPTLRRCIGGPFRAPLLPEDGPCAMLWKGRFEGTVRGATSADVICGRGCTGMFSEWWEGRSKLCENMHEGRLQLFLSGHDNDWKRPEDENILVYYSTDQDRPVVDDIIKNRFISDLVVPLDILIYTRPVFRAMSTHSSPNEKLLKRRPRASSLRRIEYLSFNFSNTVILTFI